MVSARNVTALLVLQMLVTSCIDFGFGDQAPTVLITEVQGSLAVGTVATVHGEVDDDRDATGELAVAWSFEGGDGHIFSAEEIEASEDCTAGPSDTGFGVGAVACSFRVPLGQDRLELRLSAVDSKQREGEDTLRVELVAGASPSCAVDAPNSSPPEGAYFANVEVDFDGACHDSDSETPPEELSLWFRTTYRDEGGETVTLELHPSGDTGDGSLQLEADATEARLAGSVLLPAADHQICLLAEDESGNIGGTDACVSITVHPPNEPPWCEIVLPIDGTTGAVGASMHFEGFVADGEQDPSTLYVEWRSDHYDDPIGYGTPDEDGRVTLDEVIAFDASATHTITLRVEDDWGESCEDSITYTVADGPSVRIDSPLDGDWLDISESFVLEGSYGDEETACPDLELEWAYVGPEGDASLYLGPPASGACVDGLVYDPSVSGELVDGVYLFYLFVTDTHGNTNADLVWATVGDCSQDWFLDLDGDGYGDAYEVVSDCTQPSGYVATAGDCDDDDATVNPGMVEDCNGVDDDCDGDIDDGYHSSWFYEDGDGDGYGLDEALYDADGDGTADAICSSASLTGWAPLGGDCDDGRADVNPAEAEQCDETDHDCDGSIDNGFTYPLGTELCEDGDGDGFGSTPIESCEPITGYVLDCGDCDDSDGTVHPAATEVCDDPGPVDNDCDGYADPVGSSGCTTHYVDADADGWGSDAIGGACVCASNPGEYTVPDPGDCDDADDSINPAASEICDYDEVDEDCDGYADTEGSLGCTTFFYDWDGDDYYATGAASRCLCGEDGEYRGTDSGDCNDADAAINPAASEICDATNTDEDCDGSADDDDPSATGQTPWYQDADSDGYGLAAVVLGRCDQPSGYVTDSADCDDANASIHPAATEICDPDNVDEDCDGSADDGDSSATGQSSWYRDADGDSWGTTDTVLRCDWPDGYADRGTDCDDGDPLVNPGAAEICDASNTDEDCDGLADDDDSSATGQSTWYRDADGDSWGTTSTILRCDWPAGYADRGTDCDDGDGLINPGAAEVCDSANTDEDCDGLVDDDDSSATGQSTWYYDADGDSYGTTSSVARCDQPSGYTSRSSDCDDGDAGVNPSATESCDAVDEDCDGVVDDVSATASSCTATEASLVQCCIDSLQSSGGTVYLDWSGTSTFDETIELRSDLTIDGVVTSDRPILQFDGSDDDDLIYALNESDITLKNFKAYGTRTTDETYYCSSSCSASDQHGILIDRDSGRIANILLENVAVRYAHKHGLYIERADNVELWDCNFRANGTSRAYHHNVYLLGCDGVVVDSIGSRYSAGHGINMRGCHNVTVTDGEIKYNHHAGLRVAGCTTCSSYGNSSNVLIDGLISHYNDSNGVEVREETEDGVRYYAEDVCVANSDMDGNGEWGLYFAWVDGYQRSSNSYSGNSLGDSSITNSTLDTTLCP